MHNPAILFLRPPKPHEMSLSQPVKESVDEALGSIRNALSFASRNEHPMVISVLSKVLADLDSLEMMDTVFSKAEDFYRMKMKNGEDLFS